MHIGCHFKGIQCFAYDTVIEIMGVSYFVKKQGY